MIKVNIIADTQFGDKRATTYELSYPRYIHAEAMTHRVFSRNAASSRAIPIEKMIEQVRENTVMPIWTANEKGMQGKLITNGSRLVQLNTVWNASAHAAILAAQTLNSYGAHKQNVNRILEPYQHIKVILTATEFSNFFDLRYHEDAQPEIQALAMEMFAAYHRSKPRTAHEDTSNVLGWHLPYADDIDNLATAKKVSASCCAQVSYRNNDDSIEKAEAIWDRLVGSEPRHSSPMEHQCTWGDSRSRGNLKGLHQLRQSIEDGAIQ